MALLLLLQVTLQGIQIQEPYRSREDKDLTTKVVLNNGLTVILREIKRFEGTLELA